MATSAKRLTYAQRPMNAPDGVLRRAVEHVSAAEEAGNGDEDRRRSVQRMGRLVEDWGGRYVPYFPLCPPTHFTQTK